MIGTSSEKKNACKVSRRAACWISWKITLKISKKISINYQSAVNEVILSDFDNQVGTFY